MTALALMTSSFVDREWEAALDLASAAGIPRIEACAGGYIPKRHYDPSELVTDEGAFARFADSLASRGLSLWALSCHGNPLHPDPEVGAAAHRDFEATCELAARLGIANVNLLAGCPAGGPDDSVPNWIIPSVVPDLRDQYRWQWEERVLPYWSRAREVADRHGVRICVEPHPTTVVYNVETFERLRSELGPTIGMNYDHSHLWWQGIDPRRLIERCGEAIYTVHIKDTVIDQTRVAELGVLSAADYDEADRRPWCYGTPGFGHDEKEWATIVLALRKAGYDGPLSIECEDPFVDPVDSLRLSRELLARIELREPRPPMNWPALAAEEQPAEPGR